MSQNNARRTVLLVTCCTLVAIAAGAQAESFWDKVLRVTGISATPSALKGPGDALQAGDVWIATLSTKARQRLTQEGGYRSPVFEPSRENILALKGEMLVQVPLSGADSTPLFSINGIVKLVGFRQDNPNLLLILTKDAQNQLSVGFLSLQSQQLDIVSAQELTSVQLQHLQGWERVYGDVILKQERSGSTQRTDIFLKRGEADPENINQCDKDNCSQPSLSPNGNQVTFIKEHS